MGRVRRGAIALAVSVLCGYGAICGFMYAKQTELIYPGGTIAVQPLPTPGLAGLAGFQSVTLDTPDGEHLKAWWHPPAENHGVVLYLQGNAQNIAADWRATRLRDLAEAGLGVMGVEYRGFGGSSGTPSEPGLITDAETAYDFAAAKAPGAKIALFGDSLGTAVAVALATERPVAGLWLDSPFASAERLGSLKYPWLPVSLLMRDRWASEERITQIKAPILIAQCDQDQVVPPAEAQRLFDIAVTVDPSDKIFILNNCGHVQTWRPEPTKAAALKAFTEWTTTTR